MKSVSKGLVVFAGLLATPAIPTPQPMEQKSELQNDPRVARLEEFFEGQDCPITELSADFVAAADTRDLDWRLLPSIAVIESGGGKRFKNNNVFGWNNCKDRFDSVRHGIHYVAERLANSRLYKDKDTDEILRTYNPQHRDYPARVKAVMNRIGPADQGYAGATN
jgi:hypothetical protein